MQLATMHVMSRFLHIVDIILKPVTCYNGFEIIRRLDMAYGIRMRSEGCSIDWSTISGQNLLRMVNHYFLAKTFTALAKP